MFPLRRTIKLARGADSDQPRNAERDAWGKQDGRQVFAGSF